MPWNGGFAADVFCTGLCTGYQLHSFRGVILQSSSMQRAELQIALLLSLLQKDRDLHSPQLQMKFSVSSVFTKK